MKKPNYIVVLLNEDATKYIEDSIHTDISIAEIRRDLIDSESFPEILIDFHKDAQKVLDEKNSRHQELINKVNQINQLSIICSELADIYRAYWLKHYEHFKYKVDGSLYKTHQEGIDNLPKPTNVSKFVVEPYGEFYIQLSDKVYINYLFYSSHLKDAQKPLKVLPRYSIKNYMKLLKVLSDSEQLLHQLKQNISRMKLDMYI